MGVRLHILSRPGDGIYRNTDVHLQNLQIRCHSVAQFPFGGLLCANGIVRFHVVMS